MFQSKEKKKLHKEVEALFHEIQINLENNYKDLAIAALQHAGLRLEELKIELSEKEYQKWKKVLDEYKEKMVGYHH